MSLPSTVIDAIGRLVTTCRPYRADLDASLSARQLAADLLAEPAVTPRDVVDALDTWRRSHPEWPTLADLIPLAHDARDARRAADRPRAIGGPVRTGSPAARVVAAYRAACPTAWALDRKNHDTGEVWTDAVIAHDRIGVRGRAALDHLLACAVHRARQQGVTIEVHRTLNRDWIEEGRNRAPLDPPRRRRA